MPTVAANNRAALLRVPGDDPAPPRPPLSPPWPCPAAELRDACALPIAAVLQPYAPAARPADGAAALPAADDIARCAECLGYVNHLCAFGASGWACALCGVQNDYATGAANQRYVGAARRAALPELAGPAVEALCVIHSPEEDEVRVGAVRWWWGGAVLAGPGSDSDPSCRRLSLAVPAAAGAAGQLPPAAILALSLEQSHAFPLPLQAQAGPVYEVDAAPVVIALVDTSVPAGPPVARAAALEALELVRSALAAAVEGLPPAALFGLVSFAGSVGLRIEGPEGLDSH